MTNDILSLIREREDNVALFLKHKDSFYLKRAKKLRCQINKAIKYSKSQSVKSSLEDTKTNPSKFWRIINSVLKPDVDVVAPTLIGDDSFMKTGQESVDYLNAYISKIGSVLSKNLSDFPERKDFGQNPEDEDRSQGVMFTTEAPLCCWK